MDFIDHFQNSLSLVMDLPHKGMYARYDVPLDYIIADYHVTGVESRIRFGYKELVWGIQTVERLPDERFPDRELGEPHELKYFRLGTDADYWKVQAREDKITYLYNFLPFEVTFDDNIYNVMMRFMVYVSQQSPEDKRNINLDILRFHYEKNLHHIRTSLAAVSSLFTADKN